MPFHLKKLNWNELTIGHTTKTPINKRVGSKNRKIVSVLVFQRGRGRQRLTRPASRTWATEFIDMLLSREWACTFKAHSTLNLFRTADAVPRYLPKYSATACS